MATTINRVKMKTAAKAMPAVAEEPAEMTIQKRDGTVVPFNREKIVSAAHKAMIASGEGSLKEAGMVADRVYADVFRIGKKYKNFVPTVEGVQDTVEKELILGEYVKTAKALLSIGKAFEAS